MVKKTAPQAAKQALKTGVVKTADIKARTPADSAWQPEPDKKTTASDETPEAQPTKAAKSKAAEDMFAKADAAGDLMRSGRESVQPKRDKDEVAAEEMRVQRAAGGGF